MCFLSFVLLEDNRILKQDEKDHLSCLGDSKPLFVLALLYLHRDCVYVCRRIGKTIRPPHRCALLCYIHSGPTGCILQVKVNHAQWWIEPTHVFNLLSKVVGMYSSRPALHYRGSEQVLSGLAKKVIISEKSTIFVWSSWNLVKITNSWGGQFDKVSLGSNKKCRFFTNSDFFGQSRKYLLTL